MFLLTVANYFHFFFTENFLRRKIIGINFKNYLHFPWFLNSARIVAKLVKVGLTFNLWFPKFNFKLNISKGILQHISCMNFSSRPKNRRRTYLSKTFLCVWCNYFSCFPNQLRWLKIATLLFLKALRMTLFRLNIAAAAIYLICN